MDTTFHKIDLETWERREEYEYFSRGGCGFTVTAELDITHLRRYAKAHGAKLYPMLVAVAAQAVNALSLIHIWGKAWNRNKTQTCSPRRCDPCMARGKN